MPADDLAHLSWPELYFVAVRAWQEKRTDGKAYAKALRDDTAYRAMAFGYPRVRLYTGEVIEGKERWERLTAAGSLKCVGSSAMELDEKEDEIVSCF